MSQPATNTMGNAGWSLRIMALALVLVAFVMFAEGQKDRAAFRSSELYFTDASKSGLAIMPASCASSPAYYENTLAASEDGKGYSTHAGQTEFGALKHSTHVCVTNTSGYGPGGGGFGNGGGTSPAAGHGGHFGGGGGGAGAGSGAPISGDGSRGMISISYGTTGGDWKRTLLVSGTTWTVPSDWNNANNVIRCIGGGGGGGVARGSSTAATGGGGGAYASVTNLALTPGSNVTYRIGAGGAGATRGSNGTSAGGVGGDTWFNGASLSAASCGAKGGAGGNGRTSSGTLAGAAGGAAASGKGAIRYSGGNSGSATVSSGKPSSGGGGAGGPNGNGGSSSSPAGGGVNAGGTGDNGFTAAGAHGTQFGVAKSYFIPANSAAELNSFKGVGDSIKGLRVW